MAHIMTLLCMPYHEDVDRQCKAVKTPGYVTILASGRWHCNYCGHITDAPEGIVA